MNEGMYEVARPATSERVGKGHLTNDHPSSSYGMPVFVGDGGRVYGPAEVGYLFYEPACYEDETGTELLTAAIRAGFRLYT